MGHRLCAKYSLHTSNADVKLLLPWPCILLGEDNIKDVKTINSQPTEDGRSDELYRKKLEQDKGNPGCNRSWGAGLHKTTRKPHRGDTLASN